MSLSWLIILVIYGLSMGWDQIPPLAWWLMVPFVVHNLVDMVKAFTKYPR